jgi:LAO/AO transport system kinase
MLAPAFQIKQKEIPVIKTIATEKTGVDELIKKIDWHENLTETNNKKTNLLAEKAYQLIQQKRMSDINKEELFEAISSSYKNADFNLYRFIETFKK